jgi:hypothetical protein
MGPFQRPSCFNKVGNVPVCKQSKSGWEPSKSYSHIVMSRLFGTKIHCFKFIIWASMKAAFLC